jgi:hypothetical protein
MISDVKTWQVVSQLSLPIYFHRLSCWILINSNKKHIHIEKRNKMVKDKEERLSLEEVNNKIDSQ